MKYSILIKDKNGFTLFETLVAIMILAIAIVMVLQLFSGGLRSGRLSTRYNLAIFHVKEKMEEILTFEELSEGMFSGDFGDGFLWRAEIEYVVPEEDRQRTTDLFKITVHVGWVEGIKEKHLTINTLKIAKKIIGEG